MRLDVKFFVNGEPFAVRYWDAVPRVGDEVMLGHPKKLAYRVVRVAWGVENEEGGPVNTNERQAVNVELERADDDA